MTHDNTNQHGDRNVERLISRSYRPEDPAPDFVARVEDLLLAEAASARPTGRPSRSVTVQRLTAMAAAAGLVAAVFVAGTDGELPVDIDPFRGPAGVLAPRGGSFGQVPRPRGDAPESTRVAVGDAIETGAHERRRIVLPDGSVLYVNGSSDVRVTSARGVDVRAGEVYLEVRPDASRKFVVKTPERRFTALGTRFGVTVADAATDLVVTHGKVGVSGLRNAVFSGERFTDRDGEQTVERAPRVSHLLEWTRELVAAAESPLVPKSDYGGGALVAFDPWGQEARLSLRKYSVDVHIEDGFARTTIDQTYFNHATWRLEGTFYFPLPADASLSRLAMYVGAVRMEGGMSERRHARNVYEQIVTRRRDPALLEWVDGSTFKMRVFPLEPREEKRIVLSYTQRLETLYGETKYRFPVGHTLDAVGDWSFGATVAGGATAAWECDSHALAATTAGGDLRVAQSKHDVLLKDDVVLRLRRTRMARNATRFDTVEHDGHRYLMVRHSPHLAGSQRRERRDWVFVVESSGSRDPLLARVQADVVGTLLDHAEAGDTFTVLTAGTRVRALSDALLPLSAENIAAAREFMDSTHLIGALDLEKALAAASDFAMTAANPYIVHLGGGVATLGERDPGTLAKQVPDRAKYVGVAVGRRWSRTFMKAAAARTGGHVTQIQPDEPINWRAFDLAATLAAPGLRSISVVDDAEKLTFLSFADAIGDGAEVAAIARLPKGRALPETVTISGVRDGSTWAKTLPVANAQADAGYLPRQWARLEIERLVADDSAKHEKEIVALSMSSYVMSPLTSLLVLESEEMYKQFNVDRGRSDHWAMYPAPDRIEVVREPIGQQDVVQTPDGTVTRADIERVMRTVLMRQPTRLVHDGSNWYGQGYTRNAYDTTVAFSNGVYGLSGAFFNDGLDEGGWLSDSDGDGEFRTRTENVFDRLEGVRESQAQNGRFGGRWGRRSWGQVQLRSSAGFNLNATTPMSEVNYALSGLFADQFARRDLEMPMGMPPGEPWFTASAPFDGPIGRKRERWNGKQSAERWFDDGRRSAGKNIRGSGFLGGGMRMQRLPRPLSGPTGGAFAGTRSAETRAAASDARIRHRLQGYYHGTWQQGLFLQQASPMTDLAYFSDLLGRMPAMTVSWSDVWDIVEQELPALAPRQGKIDRKARDIIELMRTSGSQVLLRSDDGVATKAVVDGRGHFRIERTYADGLQEIVVHDGQHVIHAYPSTGLAARRLPASALREELAYVAPWTLPTVERLARGSDVVYVDDRTVHVVPHSGSGRTVFSFSESGAFEGRRYENEKGEVVASEAYTSTDDGIRVTQTAGEDEHVVDIAAHRVAGRNPPIDLCLDEDLVVIELPFREWNFLQQRSNEAVKTRGGDKAASQPQKHYTDDERIAMGVTQMIQWGFGSQSQFLQQQLVQHDDRRLGVYALLLASGWQWNPHSINDESKPDQQALDPTREHPDSALAWYVKEIAQRDAGRVASIDEIDDQWLAGLARLRNETADFASGRATQDAEKQTHATARVMDLIESEADPERAYFLALVLKNWGRAQDVRARLADALDGLAERGIDRYRSRYEAAILRKQTGDPDLVKRARSDLAKLHAEVLEQGYLPPVDHRLRNAFSGAEPEWRELWHGLARRMVAGERHAVVPLLATQCSQIGDRALADELIEYARKELPEGRELLFGISIVEHWMMTGNQQRALEELEPLLDREDTAEIAPLWTLATTLAEQAGDGKRALAYHEKALDIEYRRLGDVIDLQQVRQQYQQLMSRFQQLANAAGVLDASVGDEVRTRIVTVADRWRSLDDDPTGASNMAGAIFASLGEDELAWDYLTTPLDAKPNEAAPWTNLAQRMAQTNEYVMADKAYETAFDIEPTNADILFSRAQLLRRRGRHDLARPLLEQIASGEWQPRFQNSKNQAARLLGR